MIHAGSEVTHPTDFALGTFLWNMLVTFRESAVPFFFVTSSYLFFAGRQRPYGELMRRKLLSLGLPYLLFTLIGVAMRLGLPDLFGVTPTLAETLGRMGLLAPLYPLAISIDGPLWFVRDMLIFFALSPLLSWAFQRIPWWLGLPAALAGRCLTMAGFLPGFFSANAIFHVYMGYLIATLPVERLVRRLDGLDARWLYPAVLALGGATSLALMNGGYAWLSGAVARELCIVAGICAGLHMAGHWPGPTSPLVATLASLAMFVFCAHDVGPLALAYRVVERVLTEADCGFFAVIVARTVLATGLCVALGLALRRLTPRLYALLMGGRV